MFGTVEYFTDYFKTCIMNNFSGENPFTLPTYHQNLMEEIMMQIGRSEEKEVYLRNLEKAYKKINKEIFGDWGKR